MTSKPFPYATATEARIARAIVQRALKRGLTVSVFDGEETALNRSTDEAAICAAMNSTDSDALRLRDSSGTYVGSILLIWGNDEDLVSDHSDNDLCEKLCEFPFYCA